jgi:predicted DsbA family dithiol-disulfide isomerase
MATNSDGQKPVIEVSEYTDPGCPWSWTSEPRIRWVRRRYGGHVAWRRVFGIQLDGPEGVDSDEAPEDVRRRWLAIAAHAHAPVGPRLLRAHTSTRPAARIAKAAELQGPGIADAVLRRLREAFFVVGNPPDNSEAISLALDGVPGLDLGALLDAAESAETFDAIEADVEETRAPVPSVIDLQDPGPHAGPARDDGHGRLRYGFPTLLLRSPLGERIVPGWRQLSEYQEAFEVLDPTLAQIPRGDLDASAALTLHRSLSGADLELIGDGLVPEGAVRVDTDTVPLWATAEEAEHLVRARIVAHAV